MNATELFKGVAVIIDDEINNPKANINNLIQQIKNKNIPYVTYTSIPTYETITHFQNLSFLLFDWRLDPVDLTKDEIQDGVTIPAAFGDAQIKENIKFLEDLKESCFCPVFVFSNENPNAIEDRLEEAGLYTKDRPNHIFVKSKGDLHGRVRLFREIEKWIRKNPAIYVLKEWDNGYQKSKNQLYMDFQEISSVWPRIMWENFTKDGINESHELGELIQRNLRTRMIPYEFSEEGLGKRRKKLTKEELRRVLEGERFLINDRLQNDNIMPGDIFYKSQKYYINIRPACDCIPDRRQEAEVDADDVSLYLLKGTKLTENQVKNSFNKEYGLFNEIDSQSIVFAIHNGKTIDFRFRDLEIKEWKIFKDFRIGRLLPPYIDRIQERYALYLQRHGIPRTPKGAI